MADELARSTVFYALINSRSLPAEQAARLAREIGSNLKAAAGRTGRAVAVASRGDSNLRGQIRWKWMPWAKRWAK